MRGYVARAMRAGLTKIGEPSLLRGDPCGNAVLNRGVTLERGVGTTEQDNYVGVHDIVTIDGQYDPKAGDNFSFPSSYDADGAPATYDEFTLDRLVQDNGVTRQFIVVEG